MKGFEIVKAIIEAIPEGQLEGHNFNRYGEEGEDIVPHITVRLNLRNEVPQEVKDLLDDMKERVITNWQIENPLVKPFREYSTNHHTAHETSTACAFKFYIEMVCNRNEFKIFERDKIRYLSDFLPFLLKRCGFKKLDNLLVQTSEFVENLADRCTEAFESTIDENLINDKYLFSERFIHTFHNCICILPIEEVNIICRLMRRVSYTNISIFYTDLSTSLEI